jgi:NCAIR mutase (PurE)-related protein
MVESEPDRVYWEVKMEKIEIDLNENERKALREIAFATGRTESQLIRELAKLFRERVIQHMMMRLRNDNSGMSQARGIWKNRDDLPDFGKLRRELDRL